MNNFKDLIENTKLVKQLDELFENDEIDGQTLEDSKELLFSSIGENIDNLTIYKIKLDNKIKECKEIKKHYEDLEKQYIKKLNKLNSFIIMIMNGMKTDKLNGNVGTIKKTYSKKVDITDINKIPKEYIRTKIDEEPMKKEIKKAIEQGEKIQGASVITIENISYK